MLLRVMRQRETMRYQEFVPPAPVARFVECYWVLGADGLVTPREIHSDGRIEIALKTTG